ncbi:MAG: 50S ribosomal protein L22 [Candidatus Altiarchaeales archaeon]|nr:MAG: 50S ribosomal protein L22 [Candidatus Altiarchaeales archaeon]
MELKYAFKPEDESKIAKAIGRDINISFKHAVVICDKIRGMGLGDAIKLLEAVVALEKSISFKRFNTGISHRKGLGKDNIAKYPQKAAGEILNVLRGVETNADYKGLDTERLKIINIQANKGIARRRRKPRGRWQIWRSQLVSIQVIAQET